MPSSPSSPTRHPSPADAGTVLVTGATGAIGSGLVPRLLSRGWTVRALTRDAGHLAGRDWADDVEVVTGDAGDPDDLRRALQGVDVAYYLVHSMGGEDFRRRDREMARSFGRAAHEQGVRRIVYLSGLHPDDEELSTHLASRVEVGEALLDSGVPTAVLQAAVVLGAGSVSFDMLRYLAGRLPAMVAPRWLDNRIQPIAMDDVLDLLVAAASLPPEVNRTFDVGGPDVLTYRQMLRRYAKVAGLMPRVVATVPVLTPGLASRWIGAVTPVDTGVARPLVDSLVHEVVCHEDDLGTWHGRPRAELLGFDEAVRRGLAEAVPDHAPRQLAFTGGATAVSALLGSLATDPSSAWYRSLDLPRWQPPAAVFPLVWTILYGDIAVVTAGALAEQDRRGETDEARALRLALTVNLALNAGWCAVFFRARRPWAAAAVAAALTAGSADLTRRVHDTGHHRSLRLAPYPLWCGFATALSVAVARRNPAR